MTKLRPFQAEGVEKLRTFLNGGGGALLADDMGLGKTVQTLAWWVENLNLKPIVVACPAMVKFHWEHEFRKHANIRALVLNGRTPKHHTPIAPPPAIICNFDILPFWRDWIIRLNPQVLVVDECQGIRAPTRQQGTKGIVYNKRTKAVRRLRDVPFRIALGGTGGLENEPLEMFAILNFLRQDLFPSHKQFAHKYSYARRGPFGWEYSGARNLNHLHNKLKKHLMIRRRKIDVLKDLPEKNRIVVPMREGRLKEYAEKERQFKSWMKSKQIHKRKVRGEEREVFRQELGFLLRLAGRLKLPSVIEWVNNFLEETDEKIILYAIHRKIIRQLKHGIGEEALVIHGGTPDVKRKAYVRDFNDPKKHRVLIGQLIAAGVGWSASCCSTTGTLELWWNPAKHDQADNRVHGIGRGNKGKACFNYYFIAEGTVEELVCRVLQRKQAQIDTVLDGGKSSKFDLIDLLLKEMKEVGYV